MNDMAPLQDLTSLGFTPEQTKLLEQEKIALDEQIGHESQQHFDDIFERSLAEMSAAITEASKLEWQKQFAALIRKDIEARSAHAAKGVKRLS
jgi:hypothetical protein